jgi:hypothetical protein
MWYGILQGLVWSKFLFWICGDVVIPYMYSLSRYLWDLAFMSIVRLANVQLDHHACSSGVFFMGNVQFEVVACTLNSLSNMKSDLTMGDLVQACCLRLRRCNEPPYLIDIYLARH